MNEQVDNEKIRASAAEAARSGENVREQVRGITIEALTKGRLDSARIKAVTEAVVEGINEGAAKLKDNDARRTVEEAIKGVEQALHKSAEAVRLSVKEASGKADEFAREDLQEVLEDLRDLEKLFLDTVRSAGSSANEAVRLIWQDLVEHAKRTGTDVGRSAKETVDTLEKDIAEMARNTGDAVTSTGARVGKQLAHAASGMLSGLAESLRHAADKLEEKTQDKKD